MRPIARAVLVFALIAIAPLLPARGDEPWTRAKEWNGTWIFNTQVTRTLGFDVAEANERIELDIAFFTSRDEAVEAAGEEYVQGVEKFYEVRLLRAGHKLLGGGRWKPAEQGDLTGLFTLSQFDGAEFIWFGDVRVALNGAQVNYVRGSDPKHDLLILDYSLPNFIKQRNQLRAAPGALENSTIAYQRKLEE